MFITFFFCTFFSIIQSFLLCVSICRVIFSFLVQRRGVNNRSCILVFDDAKDDDDECEEEEEEEEEEERDDSIFSRLPRNVPPWRY